MGTNKSQVGISLNFDFAALKLEEICVTTKKTMSI